MVDLSQPEALATTSLFFLLILGVCPLAMWLMMRGGHGHSMSHDDHDARAQSPATENRIVELEAEGWPASRGH